MSSYYTYNIEEESDKLPYDLAHTQIQEDSCWLVHTQYKRLVRSRDQTFSPIGHSEL
jgi:hypothetical protein